MAEEKLFLRVEPARVNAHHLYIVFDDGSDPNGFGRTVFEAGPPQFFPEAPARPITAESIQGPSRQPLRAMERYYDRSRETKADKDSADRIIELDLAPGNGLSVSEAAQILRNTVKAIDDADLEYNNSAVNSNAAVNMMLRAISIDPKILERIPVWVPGYQEILPIRQPGPPAKPIPGPKTPANPNPVVPGQRNSIQNRDDESHAGTSDPLAQDSDVLANSIAVAPIEGSPAIGIADGMTSNAETVSWPPGFNVREFALRELMIGAIYDDPVATHCVGWDRVEIMPDGRHIAHDALTGRWLLPPVSDEALRRTLGPHYAEVQERFRNRCFVHQPPTDQVAGSAAVAKAETSPIESAEIDTAEERQSGEASAPESADDTVHGQFDRLARTSPS